MDYIIVTEGLNNDEALRATQDDCKGAWLTKAQALHALGRHNEALADMTTLKETFGSDAQVCATASQSPDPTIIVFSASLLHAYHQVTGAYNRAQFEVRRAKRPNYYEMLGVPSISSVLEIKGAYKKVALECHPDKNSENEQARAEAEARFKLLGEALEVLSDEFKRKLYDEGYDKEAIEARVQAANRAAHKHNDDGCCGGGGCH